MTNIYEINKEYNDILSNPNYIDLETGEITEEWEKALIENRANLSTKCDNIARYMKNLEGENDVYKKEIWRMNSKLNVNNNKIKSLKKFLDYALNWQSLQTELFKFSYRKSEKADIFEKDKLPWKFITQETIEKIAWLPEIKKYLKEEIEARIEDAKADWREYSTEKIKKEVYLENWLNISFNNNLQIK